MANSRSATSRIVSILHERILSGRLLPGTRIRQEEVAREFGVSRLPIREALRILQSHGLVTLVASTGAWVSALNLAECQEIYLIRERLESLLIGEAVAGMSDDKLAELHQLADQVQAATDVATFITRDRAFHLATFQPAPMPQLLAMTERNWNTTQHYRRAFADLGGLPFLQDTHREHYLLLSALARRDRESAESLMSLHIRKTRLSLEQHPEIFHEAQPSRNKQT